MVNRTNRGRSGGENVKYNHLFIMDLFSLVSHERFEVSIPRPFSLGPLVRMANDIDGCCAQTKVSNAFILITYTLSDPSNTNNMYICK